MEEYIIFTSNKQYFALEIANIDRIIKYERPEPIPESSKFFIGVIQYNEKVLPVIDLTIRLYDIELNRNDDNSIIVVSWKGGKTGFLVDDVIGIKSFEEKQIEDSAMPNEYIQGFIKTEDNITIVLDSNGLLTPEQKDKIITSLEDDDRGETWL